LKKIAMTNWTIANIPPQAGKLAVVTGATGGLGYQTTIGLAQVGAEVVLTGRNDAKGHEAISKIRNRFPDAKISFEPLDLANLASVADFARRFATLHASLDLLINNAGVMALPTRQTTADGFEMQFGTNYLGHYARHNCFRCCVALASRGWSISAASRIGRGSFSSAICKASVSIRRGRHTINRNSQC
jgi:NAD(P)-dependent dehydrogenase (short-subunit alcohol dehydrogenase family)